MEAVIYHAFSRTFSGWLTDLNWLKACTMTLKDSYFDVVSRDMPQ